MQFKYAFRSVSMAAIVLMSAVSLRADTLADARKSIEALYQKRDSAIAKKDLEGATSSYSPQFVYVSKDGQKGDLNLVKTKISQIASLMQSIKTTTRLQKFTTSGKTATANVKEHLEMVVINPNTQLPQKVAIDAVSDDTWNKTEKGWQQIRTVTRSESAVMDGKTITDKVDLSSGPASSRPNKNKKSK